MNGHLREVRGTESVGRDLETLTKTLGFNWPHYQKIGCFISLIVVHKHSCSPESSEWLLISITQVHM